MWLDGIYFQLRGSLAPGKELQDSFKRSRCEEARGRGELRQLFAAQSQPPSQSQEGLVGAAGPAAASPSHPWNRLFLVTAP